MKYKDSAVAAAAKGVPDVLNTRTHQILFAADHHAYHANIIKYSNRPFEVGDWMGMNETIRDAHNAIADSASRVIFLGDFCYPSKTLIKQIPDLEDVVADFVKTFKGHIYYSEGNHETFFRRVDIPWTRIPQLFELQIRDPEFEDGKKLLACTHYGGRVWNRSHKGTWQLYGHSHGGLKNDFGDKLQDWEHATSMDVGIDTNNMKPYTWDDVKAHLKTKTFRPVDHHSAAMDLSSREEGDN